MGRVLIDFDFITLLQDRLPLTFIKDSDFKEACPKTSTWRMTRQVAV